MNDEEVIAELKTNLDRNVSTYPRLVEYELSRIPKFGPQGAYPPLSERMDKLSAYFDGNGEITIPKSERDDLVTRVRKKLFGTFHSVKALTAEEVLNRDSDEDKLDTNSGLPDFKKRSDRDVQHKAVKDAKSGKWKEYPAVVGSRSIRQKDRFIFMFPMSTNLVEKRFVIPVMEAIRNNNVLSFSAWEGFDKVELAIHEQIKSHGLKPSDVKTKATMDYTTMDNSMKMPQMMLVYEVLAPIFQPQYREELRESLEHASNIGLMIGMDKIIEGEHGLASGSGWTNLAESIISALVHQRIEDTMGIPMIFDQLLGDDGAFGFEDETVQEKIAPVIERVSGEFGLIANPDKQRVSQHDFVYLQRFFDDEIFIEGTDVMAGSYTTVLAMNSARNPERFHDARKWSAEMEILRWIMIAENAHHNPFFEYLVKLLIKGDKFGMGTLIPGFLKRRIVDNYAEAKTIRGFVPTYTQTHRDRGILEFDTVKLLRSLA
jgi:hypothetical protein